MEMIDAIDTIEAAKADFEKRTSNLVNGLSTYGFVKVSYACKGVDFRISAKLDKHDVELFACHRKDGNKNIALGVSYKNGGEWESRYSDDDTWHGLALVLVSLKYELS